MLIRNSSRLSLLALIVAAIVPVALGQLPQPAYMPPACKGKPITTVSREEMAARPTTTTEPNAPIDRAAQIKVFDDLVKAIDANYLYPEHNAKDWSAIVAGYRAKIDAGLETEAFYAAMAELVDKLGDEHSHFDSPARDAEVRASLAGHNDYVGIGVLWRPIADKNFGVVLAVIPGSPGEYNGIKQHDTILAVDGFPVVEGSRAYTQRLRGPECSRAELTLRSPGGEPRKLPVIRFKISAPQPVVSHIVKTTDGSRIGYLFIPTFLDLTIADQVRSALNAFGKLDGLILDNRQNPGGSGKVLLPMLGMFTNGTVGNFTSRAGNRPLAVTAGPVANSQTVPLVILTGRDTVSYAEVFSGVLQDIGRAKIVGQTTKGNVETLHPHYLIDGSVAWLAEESFDPPRSHAKWEGRGIKPDVEAYADWDTFTFANDPAVAAALKLLGHK